MAYELCETGRCTGPSSGLGLSIFDKMKQVTTAPGTQFKAGKSNPFSKVLAPVLKISKAAAPLTAIAVPLAAAAIPGAGIFAGPLIAGAIGSPVTVAAPIGSPVSGATPIFVPSSPTAAATITPLQSGIGVPSSGLDTTTILILGGVGLALLYFARR